MLQYYGPVSPGKNQDQGKVTENLNKEGIRMKIKLFALTALVIAVMLWSAGISGCTSGSEDWADKTLEGTVTDSVTGLPLPGVIVEVGGISTTTSDNGKYSLTGFTPANYTLTATLESYEKYQATVAIRQDSPTVYDFVMEKE